MSRNGDTSHMCPVCGKTRFPSRWSFRFCDVCGWQDDGFQEDNPDEDACANIMSLNEARKAYAEGREIE